MAEILVTSQLHCNFPPIITGSNPTKTVCNVCFQKVKISLKKYSQVQDEHEIVHRFARPLSINRTSLGHLQWRSSKGLKHPLELDVYGPLTLIPVKS